MARTNMFNIEGLKITMLWHVTDGDGIAVNVDEIDFDDPQSILALKIAQELYPYYRDFARSTAYYELYEPKYHKISPEYSVIRDSFVDMLCEASTNEAVTREAIRVSNPRKRKKSLGYVYIVRAVTPDNHYKIGCSKKPIERIENLGVKLPFPLKVLHLIESNDYKKAEKHYHEVYAHKRVDGEWFALDDHDLLELLETAIYNFDEADY